MIISWDNPNLIKKEDVLKMIDEWYEEYRWLTWEQLSSLKQKIGGGE